jgi:hypothetical protein
MSGPPFFADTMAGLRVLAAASPLTSRLNITTPTVIKAAPGVVMKVSILRAWTYPATLHDARSLAEANATTAAAVIPAMIGVVTIHWACDFGIVIVPGRGMTLAVSYR